MTKPINKLLPFAVSFLFAFLLTATCLHAAQSTITDSEGYACMGDDKSRKQTEQAAVADAKRKASEAALSYLKSETRIKDMEFEKDLVSAYSNAQVRVIQELEKGWYKDTSSGDCYKVSVKAEVIPDEKAVNAAAKDHAIDDPNMPLKVNAWTDKKEYRKGEKIRVYIKGNKPFYARVLYKDVKGEVLQLLPNPYRSDNYFHGGTIYEIPSGNDRFELEVSPPFGEENILVYAGSSQLGDIALKAEGGVYQVRTKTKDIGVGTRGVKLLQKTGGIGNTPAEFYEGKLSLKTGK